MARTLIGRGLLLACVAGLAGCQEIRLRDKTVTLATTTTDLFYLQVLDNLARMIDNPTALPYFDGPTQGTAQIQNSLQAQYALNLDRISAGLYLFDKQSGQLQGQHVSQESWQIAPLYDPDRLYLMQCAYRKAIGSADPECERILGAYYARKMQSEETSKSADIPTKDTVRPPTAKRPEGMQPLHLDIPYWSFLRQGWFGVGGKKDVPKDACYVGHHGKTFVWVSADNYDNLTKFTLAILDIYTVISEPGRQTNSPGYIPPAAPATLK